MRRALVITIFTLLPWAVGAAEVNVGGTTINVPTPKGFAKLTHDVQPLYDVALDTTNPNNRRLVTFVDEEIVPSALAGETLALKRYINVEVLRKFESFTATKSDFSQLQKLMRDSLEEQIEKVEESMPGKMEGLSNRVGETLDLDLALSLNNVVPLPIHRETQRTTAHSMIIKYGMSTAGAETGFVVTVTTTFLFVKGKIVYVYVYGGPKDLSWTRDRAARLIDNIIAAN